MELRACVRKLVFRQLEIQWAIIHSQRIMNSCEIVSVDKMSGDIIRDDYNVYIVDKRIIRAVVLWLVECRWGNKKEEHGVGGWEMNCAWIVCAVLLLGL